MVKIWKWIRNLFLGLVLIIGGVFAGPTIYHTVFSNEPLSGAAQSLLWSCDFSVDGCGFDLAPVGGVLNITSTTRRDFNLSLYTWTNFSYDLYCPNTATLFKHQIVDATGSDKWYWENCGAATCDVKSEDAYETAGTFPSTGYTTVWIASNRSTNTSTIMWTGKSGGPFTSTAGAFNVVAGANSTELTTTSSGSDCLVDNMYLYVATSEFGGESNASPVISAVANTSITNQSAVISWTTDIGGNSTVRYGVTTAVSSSVGDASYNTSHALSLTGLINNTLYYYNVSSCNSGGNCSFSTQYDFTTLQYGAGTITCIYNQTFTSTAGNWSGGTLNTTGNRYEGPASGQLYLNDNGLNLNLGDYPLVNISMRMYWLSNNTRTKFFYEAANHTLSGNSLLSEWQSGSSDYVLKPEPVYTPQITAVTANAWHTLTLLKNTSATNTFTYILDGTSRSLVHTIVGNDYFNIDVGTGGLGLYFTNMTICVLGESDTTPPVITDPAITNKKDSSATVTWTTDESSTTSVKYGTTSAMTSSASGSSGTSHSVPLSSLTYGTLYYYNVTSCDTNNNCATAGPNTFTTYGQIFITHNSPSGNVVQNQFFAYNDTISCLGGLQNSSCGDVSIYLDPIIQDGDTCAQGQTCSNLYENFINGYSNNAPGDVSHYVIHTYNGQPHLFIPWFGVGPPWDVCYPSAVHLSTCGLSGTAADTLFCQVTDEFSQFGQTMAQSHNTTFLNTVAPAYFNTIKTMNATVAKESRNLGNGTFWILGYNAGTVTFSDRNTATDADARIIISLLNLANNSYYTNTTQKAEMKAYALTMCQSLKDTGVNTVNHPSSIDGHTVHYWYTGSGTNSFSSASLGYTGFSYPGYAGDLSLAYLACGLQTNDTSYFARMNDTLENWLQMAGYSGSVSGLKFPNGVNGHWTNLAGTPSWVCDAGCGTPGATDDADAIRFVSMCLTPYYAAQANVSVNPHIISFCNNLKADSAYAPNSWVIQWYSDGTHKSSADSGFRANGLALFLDPYLNVSRTLPRVGYMASSSNWDLTNMRETGKSCLNLYWTAFGINTLGHALGRSAAAFTLSNITAGNETPMSDKGGLVSTVSETTPFYTTNNNPQNTACLQSLVGSASCSIQWLVNATGTVGNNYTFYSYANSTFSSQQQSANVTITITSNASDTTAPTIGAITINKGYTSANFSWTTGETANTTLQYGTTIAYGTTLSDITFITSHSFTPTPLNDETTYYYNITNCDASNNCNTTASSFMTNNYTVTIGYCSGISAVRFLGDVRKFNFTTYTITDYNISAQNQTTCLFNITKGGTKTHNYNIVTNTTTTSKQRVYCGTTLASKTEINTSVVQILTNVVNSTIGCWSDWIGLGGANYKDINITVSQV